MSEQTSGLIYQTIINVMGKVKAVSKDRKNQMQGFIYRGIDDVMNELHSIMSECGLFVVPTVKNEVREERKNSKGNLLLYTRLTILFTFYASDGSNIQSIVIGEAMDTGDKASNKALSVGLKYALLQVLCIPTEDNKDPDANTYTPASKTADTHQTTQPPQVKPPVAGMKKASELVLKGGATTPQERERMRELLDAKYDNGTFIFTREETTAYSAKRKTEMTAAELITFIENALRNRNPNAPELHDTVQEPTPAEMAQKALNAAQMTPAETQGASGAFEIF